MGMPLRRAIRRSPNALKRGIQALGNDPCMVTVSAPSTSPTKDFSNWGSLSTAAALLDRYPIKAFAQQIGMAGGRLTRRSPPPRSTVTRPAVGGW